MTIDIEFRAVVDQAVDGIGNLGKGFVGLSKSVSDDANGALQTFGVNLGALNNPLTLVAQGVKSSIDYTAQWADEIDGLSRVTGQSARDTSILATVLGDYGIGAQQVKTAAKALKDEGLTPTIGTLKELAKEYQALPEGAARTEWGTKKLGRAYFDLSEILSKTPAEFDQLTSAALRSGKVMGEDGVEAAQKYKLQMAQLSDQLDGLKLKIGGPVIDTVSKAVTAYDQWGMTVRLLGVKVEQLTGQLTDGEAAIKATQIVGGDLAAVIGDVADASDRATAAAAAATPVNQTYTNELIYRRDALVKMNDELSLATAADIDHQLSVRAAAEAVGESVRDYQDEQAAIAASTQAKLDDKIATDAVASATAQFSAQMLYSKAVQGESAEVALTVGRALGVVDEATYGAMKRQGELKAAFDAHIITLAQYSAGLQKIKADVDNLSDKTITVKVITQGGEIGTVSTTEGAGAQKTTKRADGGEVRAGGTYTWNEPGHEGEVLVPAGNGYVLTKADAQAALAGAGGGVNIAPGAIVIHAAPGMDVNALADAVMSRMAAKTRAYGQAGARYLGS